jgi:hypothetical protein
MCPCMPCSHCSEESGHTSAAAWSARSWGSIPSLLLVRNRTHNHQGSGAGTGARSATTTFSGTVTVRPYPACTSLEEEGRKVRGAEADSIGAMATESLHLQVHTPSYKSFSALTGLMCLMSHPLVLNVCVHMSPLSSYFLNVRTWLTRTESTLNPL